MTAFGVGGEMPTKVETAPETGDTFYQPAWTFHGRAPVGDTHIEWAADIANGTRESMYIDVLGSYALDPTVEALRNAAGDLVGQGKTLASSITARADSLQEDFVSMLRLDRTEPQRCDFQGDLDGVQVWSNQSVVHADCHGLVSLDHEAENSGVNWTMGTTDSSGSLDDVSVQFKNDTDRRGGTTYRDVTVDTTGTLDYEEPFLRYREGDKEYTVPECMLKGNC